MQRHADWVSISYESLRLDRMYSIELRRTQLDDGGGGHGGGGGGLLDKMMNVNSKYSCWNECLDLNECVAITFDSESRECRLLSRAGFTASSSSRYLAVRRDNWVTLIRDDDENHNDDHTVDSRLRYHDLFRNYTYRYENAKLTTPTTPHVSVVSANNEVECWTRCVDGESVSGCVAISFGDVRICHLYRRVDLTAASVESAQGWVTITYEREQRLDRDKIVLSELYQKCSFRVVEQPPWLGPRSHSSGVEISLTRTSSLDEKRHMERWLKYERTQIHGEFLRIVGGKSEKSSSIGVVMSEFECWNECVKNSECWAISYSAKFNTCQLVKPGKYRLNRYNDWVSICFDSPSSSTSNSDHLNAALSYNYTIKW